MSEPRFCKQGAPQDGMDNKDRTGCRQDASLYLTSSLLPTQKIKIIYPFEVWN